jgi:hypothetical protein
MPIPQPIPRTNDSSIESHVCVRVCVTERGMRQYLSSVQGVCELMSECLLVDIVYGIDSVLMDKL